LLGRQLGGVGDELPGAAAAVPRCETVVRAGGRHPLRRRLQQGVEHREAEALLEAGDAKFPQFPEPHPGHEKHLAAGVLDNAAALAGQGAHPGGEAFIEGGHGNSEKNQGAMIPPGPPLSHPGKGPGAKGVANTSLDAATCGRMTPWTLPPRRRSFPATPPPAGCSFWWLPRASTSSTASSCRCWRRWSSPSPAGRCTSAWRGPAATTTPWPPPSPCW